MKRKLDVYLHRHLVGNLVQDAHGQITFDYAKTWLKDPAAIALSHSLPLTKKHFTKNECRGFFAGILPEEGKREIIAKNLGISARNDYAMLERIGGECAGAVTFMPTGIELPQREDTYRALTDKELAEILTALPRRPLMAGDEGVRLSLAGVQDKIAVHVSEKKISIPVGESPSTHILKPAIERFEGAVFNEAFCMKLAREIGMNTAHVETGRVEGIDYLLVERYDRTTASGAPGASQILKREHQEDFCQALGIVPENKYQAEGGPSLKQCFALVRDATSAPVIELQVLLDAVIFNFLIGNRDAHGKNFSFLYTGGQTRLAPLYDLLSTSYYSELSPKMAMKIGGEYSSAKINSKHFQQLAEEAGLAKPMVRRRVPELAELILSTMPAVVADHPVAQAVAKLIRGNCDRTIGKFKA
jgi:serine/threonine-protein kinase HipA